MMNRFNRLFRLALLSACATFAAGASMAANAPASNADAARVKDLAKQITMYAGQVKLIPIGNIKRVALGNGKLVSVKRVGHQLILIGQAPGATNMLLWKRHGGVEAYNILINATDVAQGSYSLSNALSDIPGLKVKAQGGHIVLTGDVTQEDSKRIDKVVGQQRDVINLTHAQSVNMKRMVYLDVQVVDFKKSALRNLGIKWQNLIAGPAVGIVKDWQTNPYFRLGDVTQGGNAANAFYGYTAGSSGGSSQMGILQAMPQLAVPYSKYLGITTSLSSVINLAAQNGDAYILANPQLSTRSGGDAKFLAGGEVPIPVSGALGSTSVQYKNYGVRLNIKPMADKHGNVMADIDTEVSQIDPSVKIDGYPGFLTRKTSSVVNVKSGQTIVLSGLIQSTGAKTIDKFPWLGDIPILGALFRSKDFQAKRSELVIFVTPKIFTPESELNRRAVDRGVEIVNGFNKQYGKGLYMPGFGVGPTRNQTEKPAASKAGDTSGKSVPAAMTKPEAAAGKSAVAPATAVTTMASASVAPAAATSTAAPANTAPMPAAGGSGSTAAADAKANTTTADMAKKAADPASTANTRAAAVHPASSATSSSASSAPAAN
jgi:pilus assembly protein CpaC